MRVAYPKFDEIVEKCRAKIKENFSEYQNTWQTTDLLGCHGFWFSRLQEEIDEIWKSESWKGGQKEIIDAINILAFMYELSKNEIDFENETDKETKELEQQNSVKVIVG